MLSKKLMNHRTSGKVCMMIGMLLVVPGVGAQAAFSSLEEQMSGEEFRRAGLHRLSEAELDFLNGWLRGDERIAPAPTPAPAGASAAPQASTGVTEEQMGLRSGPVERVLIESRIDGEFNGWSGRTRFALENGQVWEQIGGGRLNMRADSPAVRIEPKALGSWKLYVEGMGKGVRVKRIR